MADLETIVKRYQRLKTDRWNWDNLWQELADYMVPWRNSVIVQETPGIRRTDRIFDGTAPRALTIASSAIHGTLTPNSLRWFTLRPRDHMLAADLEVNEWLEETTDRIFSAINQSNFDSEAQEIYSDLLAFGTGVMWIEEQDIRQGELFSGLRFQTYSPGNYVIAEGPDGLVDTVFFERRVRLGALAAQYGIESLSEGSQDHIRQGKQDFQTTVVQGVMPRRDVALERANTDAVAQNRRPIATITFELGSPARELVGPSQSSNTEAHKLEERGFLEMPVVVPRWRKMSGETYGRSPGMNVLPDVRTLNQAVELRLKAWALAIAPPLKIRDRGVIGTRNLRPFGETYVRTNDAIEPILLGQNFDVANFQESELRQAIEAGFFIDQIRLSGSSGQTPLSATEAAIHFQTMQRLLGPTVSRLQSELLEPLINRVVRLMFRRGVFSPPPAQLLDNGGIDVVFEGPLARVQRSSDVEAINQFLALLFPMGEVAPDIFDRVDFDGVVEVLHRATSAPARILASEEEIEAKRAQRQQQQALQQGLNTLTQASEVLSNVPPQREGGLEPNV